MEKEKQVSDKLRVGFIGLGMMGNPMSRRVLGAGFPLTVHDIRPASVEELVKAGAKNAASPREIAEVSDVVLTSLPTQKACDEVYFGPNGILKGARKGQILVETSTVSPNAVRHVAEEARKQGVGVVDAPILSRTAFHADIAKLKAPEVVLRGQVTLMVGGEAADVEKVRPVIGAYGDPIFHMGPIGSGTMIKVLNAATTHAYFAVACEVFAVAAKAGIDLKKLEEIFRNTSAKSGAMNNNMPQYLKTGTGRMMSVAAALKDSEAMLEMARELNVPVLMQSVNHTYYQMSLMNGTSKELPWDSEMMKLFESYIGKPIRFAE